MTHRAATAPDLTELTGRMFQALNEGDIETFIGALGPNPVFDVSPWGFGIYEGNPAIRRFLEDWMGSFDAYERIPETIDHVGNGIVFAAAATRGTPAGRRTQIRLSGASVVVWSAGKIERVNNYRDTRAGRRAAELLAEERAQVPLTA